MSRKRVVCRIAVVSALGVAVLGGIAVAEPQVGFDVSPDPPTAGSTVTFSAHDPCVAPVTCIWNFGDGSDEKSGQTVDHVYADAGLVDASLTTDDPEDALDAVTTSKQLLVLPALAPNRAPEASFSASRTSVATGESVQFDSSASTDPDDDALSREWDLDGDGSFETGDVVKPFMSYTADGSVIVSLRVTDPDRASDQAAVTITVLNRPPTASISATQTTPLAGDTVTFTASATDADGTISYAWDLDHDGDFDDGAGMTASKAFAEPGAAVVGLKVTDDDNASVTVAKELTVQSRPVSAAPEPPAGAPPAAMPVLTAVPPRLMSPFPVVRFAGALTSRGARLTLFTVRVPRQGARIATRCHGKRCPRAQALPAAGLKRLVALQRSYRAGVRIVIRVTTAHQIGKYVRITIRKGKPPARRDACLWPGSRVPRVCTT